jgi:hypothetical protein
MNCATDTIRIGISPGELLDRLSILSIKGRRISDPEKAAHVREEQLALEEVRRGAIPPSHAIDELQARLAAVNEALWMREDEVRDCEKNGDFGDRFIEAARSIYLLNDERFALKRKINLLLKAAQIEEKSYQS